MHHINTLLAVITHRPVLAYGAIFLIALSEYLALIGLIIPGTAIMFGEWIMRLESTATITGCAGGQSAAGMGKQAVFIKLIGANI